MLLFLSPLFVFSKLHFSKKKKNENQEHYQSVEPLGYRSGTKYLQMLSADEKCRR